MEFVGDDGNRPEVDDFLNFGRIAIRPYWANHLLSNTTVKDNIWEVCRWFTRERAESNTI